jgi:hypothetical protein
VAVAVVLAVVLAVVVTAVSAVVARALWRTVRGLQRALAATTERLRPLIEELQAEAAVTTTEVEAVQRRLSTVTSDRTAR